MIEGHWCLWVGAEIRLCIKSPDMVVETREGRHVGQDFH